MGGGVHTNDQLCCCYETRTCNRMISRFYAKLAELRQRIRANSLPVLHQENPNLTHNIYIQGYNFGNKTSRGWRGGVRVFLTNIFIDFFLGKFFLLNFRQFSRLISFWSVLAFKFFLAVQVASKILKIQKICILHI